MKHKRTDDEENDGEITDSSAGGQGEGSDLAGKRRRTESDRSGDYSQTSSIQTHPSAAPLILPTSSIQQTNNLSSASPSKHQQLNFNLDQSSTLVSAPDSTSTYAFQQNSNSFLIRTRAQNTLTSLCSSIGMNEASFNLCASVLPLVISECYGSEDDKDLSSFITATIWFIQRLPRYLETAQSKPHKLHELISLHGILSEKISNKVEHLQRVFSVMKHVAQKCTNCAADIPLEEITAALQQAENIQLQFTQLKRIFDFSLASFKILSKEGDGTPEHVLAFSAFHRFSWLVFFSSKLQFQLEDEKLDRLLSLYSVLFTSTQVKRVFRRSISEVLSNLVGTTASQPDLSDTSDWIDKITTLKTALSVTCQIPLDIFCQSASQFHERAIARLGSFPTSHQQQQQRQHWTYTGVTNPPGLEWPVYVSLLDTAPVSYLNQNMDFLERDIERAIGSCSYELDLRHFLQEWRPLATPRRSAKTFQSVARSCSRSLKTDFAKASVFSQIMPATPLTARPFTRDSSGLTIADSAGFEERLKAFCRTWMAERDKNLTKTFPANTSIKLQQLISTFTSSLSSISSDHDHNWSLIQPVFIKLFCSYGGQCKDSSLRVVLTTDKIFQKALLMCSFEIIRSAMNLPASWFQHGMRLLEVPLMALGPVMNMISERELWLSKAVVKRLKEVEERLLESEIWGEADIYRLLNSATSQIRNDSEVGNFYSTLMVYAEVTDPENSYEASDSDPVMNKVMKGLQTFTYKVCIMAKLRLNLLVTSLPVDKSVVEKAWRLVQDMFQQEHYNKLLSRRHLDVLILCCIFSACRLNNFNLSFNDLIQNYRSQPQCLESCFSAIPLDDGQKTGTIVEFYNSTFLPKLRRVLQSQREQCPLDAISTRPIEMFSPMRRRAGHPQVPGAGAALSAMTPMTRKLYNYGESPLKPRIAGSTQRMTSRLQFNRTLRQPC